MMKNRLLTTAALIGVVALGADAAEAQSTGIQLLPPTQTGSTTICAPESNAILTMTNAGIPGSHQSAINCVTGSTLSSNGNFSTNGSGTFGQNLTTNGSVQVGNSNAACNSGNAGAIRFNPSNLTFEGCNGSNWAAIGGGGVTMVVGGCQTSWSSCPAGYRATSYFSPGTYNCCDKCGNPSWKYTVCSQ